MAKLPRKTLLQFGSTVNAGSEIGQFGSYASPVYSNDTDVLQAGTAWQRGWAAETIATNRPFLEDFNAIDFVYGYMLSYIFQMGIAEYDAATTYYLNSIVQIAGQFYLSLADSNVGNAPASSPSSWLPGIPGMEVTGVVKDYAGDVAPAGYLICDGSAINRTTYAALFTVIGTKYGAGNGTTTFNIPDCRERVIAGYKSGSTEFGTVGQTGGEKTHTLTTAEMPVHNHALQGPVALRFSGPLGLYGGNPGADTDTNPTNTQNAGGGDPHNNLQPYVVMNKIIKT